MTTFRCSSCGELHEGLPELAFRAPDLYTTLSEADRERSSLTSDLCTVRDEHFFVRACLPVPVLDGEDEYRFGVWVALSRPNFDRYVELFEAEDPQDGPWFAWLCNRFPEYPETRALKAHLRLQPYPSRPLVELEPTDHPLAVHQRDGVELQRIVDLLHATGLL